MKRTFIETSNFTKHWLDIGLTEDNLAALQMIIMDNPKIGKVIRGTGRLRKMRYAPEGIGKSGAYRICYVDFTEYETVYLMTVYSKKEKDSLSKAECISLKHMIDEIEKRFKQED